MAFYAQDEEFCALLDLGADINAINMWGHTSLRTGNANHQIIWEHGGVSLRYGSAARDVCVVAVDPGAPKRDGAAGGLVGVENTLMFPAYLWGTGTFAQCLDQIRAGVDPDGRDHHGMTVVFFSRRTSTEALVELGADINAFDRYGRTPLWYSVEGHEWDQGGFVAECSERDAERKRKRRVMCVSLLSIPGLPKGMALRVVWWVNKTH